MSAKYVKIDETEVPENIRFDVPRRNQGQIVEVAYGTFGRAEADEGDPYRRVIDRSEPHPTPTYYRLSR